MKKKKSNRHWYRFGLLNSIMVLIDHSSGEPMAQIECHFSSDHEFRDLDELEFPDNLLAVARGSMQKFGFDAMNGKTLQDAMIRAIEWCEDMVGPPVERVSPWTLYFKALLFWKYKAIWENRRIKVLVPRNLMK